MKYKYFLLVLIVLFSLTDISAQNNSNEISFWVDGVCGMCEDRIEEAALATRGVSIANWNVDTKILKLSINDKFNEDRLHNNIANVGHDTKKVKAPDAVYDALHACCHYRSEVEELVHEKGLYSTRVVGRVIESGENGTLPLPGANIFWAGTNLGVISDEMGLFQIELTEESKHLVASYVGYGRDTIKIEEALAMEIEFNKTRGLDEVRIVFRTASSTFDIRNAFNVQNMQGKELLKAACCNLSESFETNPAVDVSFTDAVTGTRQIEMLGLAGPYVQITRENMPNIRGLASIYGLTYIPGPWISSIQLNSGTGSVVNGFESIAGQINVELQKPEDSEKLYLNLFGNGAGRMEANLNTSFKLNTKLSTSLLLHGKYQAYQVDKNNDGFLDHPTGNNKIFLNRWKYESDNGFQSQLGIKATFIDNQSGQSAYDFQESKEDQSSWGASMNTRRIEGWFKAGKVFESRPYSSLGFQLSGMTHEQDGFFGRRVYTGSQQSLYANIIYQGILGNTNHQYKSGTSLQYDKYDEILENNNYLRTEVVPGAFLEYTYSLLEKFSFVSGLRADYHNSYGLFFTPRLHLRYAPFEKSVIRAMIGRGQKTANIISENIGMLASSREIIIEGEANENPYGLDPEIAWNAGISFAQSFSIDGRNGQFKTDYYYTWFDNQIIANFDREPGAVYFHNLDGQSFAGSFHSQVDYELLLRYTIRLAYRFNDVRSTIDGELLEEALSPRHRAFINMAYETINLWKFDLTANWQGEKRIPSTLSNPQEFRLETHSPDFVLLNGQISKGFGRKFELYLGAENILNYRQENPIIEAENPFGDNFDASLIWGPVFGRKVYAGLRYRID